MQTNIIRLPEVIKRIGLSRSTIYALIGAGQFPRQIELSARAVGWLEGDIASWIVGRINRSRAGRKSPN